MPKSEALYTDTTQFQFMFLFVPQKVLAGEEAGAHLILVTRGDNNTLTFADENVILEHIRQYQIKFSAILLPQGEQSAMAFYDSGKFFDQLVFCPTIYLFIIFFHLIFQTI